MCTITIQTNKEVIFKKVEKLKPHLTFYQSKLETFTDQEGKEWTGYDYYAKKINWDNVLNKAWLYTKIFFATSIICIIAYTFGTFYPNKISSKKVTSQTDNFIYKKLKI